jgi:HPt (histidine-containing phosphotransfer) domain-containing protein
VTFEALMADLKREYIEALPGKIESLQQQFRTSEFETLTDEFHKLKGNGKTYGIPEVSKLGEVMELVCKEQPQALKWAIPTAIEILGEILGTRTQDSAFAIEQDSRFLKIKTLVNI